MKNILLILLMSVLLVGCSENRVLYDDLTNKGTKDSPTMYIEGKLFSGVGFDVYPNGQLKFEYNFKNGKANGPQKIWFESGQLYREFNTKDGEMDGLSSEYNYEGKFYRQKTYKKGELNGLWAKYYNNGQLKVKGTIKDGKEVGLWQEYYEHGQLYRENVMNKDGKADGLGKEYHENGQLYREVMKKDGELIYENCWDKYGNSIYCPYAPE